MLQDSAWANSIRRRASGHLDVAGHVVVVASGETERRSLPHLVSHLQKQGTSVADVRIPPRNKALDAGVAEKRDLGNVDDSRPDEIENPKLHLKNILGQVYTARVSEEISRALDAETIARRSPSFRCFMEALLNGVDHA